MVAQEGTLLKWDMRACKQMSADDSVRSVKQWNCLPVSVVTEQDYKSFKSKLATVLGDKLFWHPP